MVVAGVDAGEQGVELVGDAMLLWQRRQRQGHAFDVSARHADLAGRGLQFLVKIRPRRMRICGLFDVARKGDRAVESHTNQLIGINQCMADLAYACAGTHQITIAVVSGE
ncbi:hypothetical protein ASF43_17495 [Pseudorhodoferax sp. Leaf267]|nr:hypothetical protein ASF43_17495 [Pseudorhodoferax sp. Leaf267]